MSSEDSPPALSGNATSLVTVDTACTDNTVVQTNLEHSRDLAWNLMENIFKRLPLMVQVLTVPRLCQSAKKWSAPRAVALRDERRRRLRHQVDFAWQDPENIVPLWAVQERWEQLSGKQRKTAALRAAYAGDVEALTWVAEHYTADHFHSSMQQLGLAAASGGQLAVLQWLQNHGCAVLSTKDICNRAAENGHLEVLTWLHANGCPVNENVIMSAAERGDVEMLQYLYANRNTRWNQQWLSQSAARGGHLAALKWFKSKGCPWGKGTADGAAKYGHLEVLQYLHAQGCPFGFSICDFAASGGHLEVLKWLRESGCPFSEDICDHAAAGGHLATLKWLRESGCPFSEDICDHAAANGRLEVLKYLRASGCTLSPSIFARAAKSGHIEVMNWLRRVEAGLA